VQQTVQEHFWFRLAQPNALILCFYRNFYLKTGFHFSEIALEWLIWGDDNQCAAGK